MKIYQCAGVLLLAALISTNVTLAGEVKIPLYSHPNNGGLETNVWMVSLETLKKAPQWKITEGEPPLPVGRAIELAKKWIVSRGCDTNSWLLKVSIQPVGVGPGGGEYRNVWYYNIVFGGVGILGHFQRCIMLMDGTIVEPKWLSATPKHPLDYRVYDE